MPPPVWDPKEQNSKLYHEDENPSAGVVTVRYRPPSDSDLANLQSTEIYHIVENSEGFGLKYQIKKSV